ncbi:restriction endonuclease subunit S [Streptomyces sp. NPDC001985]|uniref:restriction endonuclease subunit S n=1 Tax=Streptomyces sp. NPDC001985 TaxID=3154406 RepID=UPI00332E7325
MSAGGWPGVPLGELCDISIGRTPPRAERRYWGGDLPWLSIADMNDGRDLSRTKEGVTALAAEGPAGRLVAPGTLLLSFKLSVGKVGFARVPMYTNEAIAALPVKDASRVHGDFLYWALRCADLLREADDAAMGKNLNKKKLAAFEVPLPPLAEQRYIAALLDEAEALRAARREAIALLGELPGSVFLDLFGDPVGNPKGFPQHALTEVCHSHSGGTPSKSVPSHWEGDLPWFSAKDMKRPDLFTSRDTISPEVPELTALRLLPADTVAIVVRGMILAHSFPVCVLRVPATVNQDLKALIPKGAGAGLDPQFLAHCLRAQKAHALSQVSQAAHGTTRLDGDGLARLKVLLPPPGLQREFARRVAGIEAERKIHEEQLTALDDLFISLQHRAFAGALLEPTA